MSGARQSDCNRVLVVEDLPEVRQLLRMVMESAGYEVIEAGSGAEARQALQSGRFVLAMVDINLPDCDGVELAASMRKDDPGASMKLICVTGDLDLAAALASPGSPFDDCITKPFGVAELLQRVSRLCCRDA